MDARNVRWAMTEFVTDARKFSRKISQSRNDDWPGPDECFYCCEAFAADKVRYPVRNWNWPEPDLVSICWECFKEADWDVTSRQDRNPRKCEGCGALISNPSKGVFAYQVCSRRCYLRAYRKRRRKHGGSTIAWKAQTPRCRNCQRAFEPARKDARYCSNACRQRAYRQRGDA
jgi:hypothetical protein